MADSKSLVISYMMKLNKIITIIKANITRRKLQSFLIALCLAFAFMLLSTTLIIIKGMQKPFDKMYTDQNASEILLIYDAFDYPEHEMLKWLSAQKEVVSVSNPNALVSLDRKLIHKGQEIDLSIHLTEYQSSNKDQDIITVKEALSLDGPEFGEIWVASHLANSNKIALGDTLGVPLSKGLHPLKVSGIIVDPLYPSGLFNPGRAWVKEGSLPYLFSVFEIHQRSLGIKTQSKNNYKKLLDRFTLEFNYEGQVITYDLIKNVFLSFYNIISVILLLFSILAIVVSIVSVHSTLSTSIRADIQQIGLLRSIGFLPSQIVKIYVAQTMIMGLLFTPLSVILSVVLSSAILSSTHNSLGISGLSIDFYIPIFLTYVIFAFILLSTGLLSCRKAIKTDIISALNEDLVNTKGRSIFTPLNLASSAKSIFIGIKLFFYNFKRSFFTGISLVLFFFILFLSFHISNSFDKMSENKVEWGLENADLIVRRNDNVALPLKHEEVLSSLDHPDIISILPFDYVSGTVLQEGNSEIKNINGKVYSTAIEETGLSNIHGKHPSQADEISICMGTAKELGIEVGDRIQMILHSIKSDFYVTGIYQDISNLGQGFRLRESAILEILPLYTPSNYLIQLNPNKSNRSFKNKLESRFGETLSVELSLEKRKGIQRTITNLKLSFILLSVFFMVILGIILANDTIIGILENQRNLGILKAIGFTPSGLRLILIIKIFILASLALLISFLGVFALIPFLMNHIGSSIGLRRFPIEINFWGSLLLVPILYILIGGIIWFSSRSLSNSSIHRLISK